MRLRFLRQALCFLPVVLSGKAALAQGVNTALLPDSYKQGFSLQQFDPAPAGDRFFAIPNAAVSGHLKPSAMLLLNYALNPLKLRDRTADKDVGYLTTTQLYAHLNVSLPIKDRVLLNVDFPIALAQSGEKDKVPTEPPKSGKLADMRLNLRAGLVGDHQKPFALGLQVDTFLPTGDKNNLTGDGQVRVNPKLVVSGKKDNIVYAANVGFLVRKHLDLGNPEIGNAITFGGAVGITALDDRLQIGPEIYGNTVLPAEGSDSPFLGRSSSPVEALLGARLRAGPAVLGLGVGPGLTKAPGVAQFRGVFSAAYVPDTSEAPDQDKDGIPDDKDACPQTPGVATNNPRTNGCPPAPPDQDNDGIPDAQDACPTTPGAPNPDPSKHGCPPDRDGDGIPDSVDACPDEPGEKNDDPAKNGCPKDTDNDGVPDVKDACPTVPGVKHEDPKKNGCPSDRDNDGIPDNVDACPDVPGIESKIPAEHGCPKKAEVKGKKIELNEQVQFDTGKATIRPESDKLLSDIAEIMKKNPEIELILVEGHTDNVGNKGANKILSRNRAKAVVDWLVKKGGIEAKRMKFEGFGQDRPIADNSTDAGRQKNRRVEITILKRKGDTTTATPPKGPQVAPKKK